MDTKADIPNARLKKRAKLSLIWLVPTVAAAAAGWLVFRNLEKIGPTISIQFDDGSGLVANQTVIRYRGVNIGSVRSVQLSADTQHVDVAARLDSSAKMLARNGSIFWVVRPEVGAGGLSGLETIVSGPYIQVEPGGKPGPKQDKFKGAMEAPILPLPGGGTEFILRTPRAGSLTDASPVYYRGIAVGSVHYIRLPENSTEVEIHVTIKSNFAPLVRTNSVFWNAGGINVDLHLLGLMGIDISAENLRSLVVGGIAFATPDEAGAPAPAGTQFALQDKLKDKWLHWSPAITITNSEVTAPGEKAGESLLNTVSVPGK